MTAIQTLTAQPPTRPTMSIPETAVLLGISRSAAYRAVTRGEIPSVRIGRRLLVPTAKLYTMLGWTYDPTQCSRQPDAVNATTPTTTTRRTTNLTAQVSR